MAPLQCFNSSLYVGLEEVDDIPYQCIAPTASKSRCKWNIDANDFARAEALRDQACRLEHGAERDGIIRQFVLLHCCTRQHRWRLEGDSNCLGRVVRTYAASIGVLPPVVNSSNPWGSLASSTPPATQPYMLPTPSPEPVIEARLQNIASRSTSTTQKLEEETVRAATFTQASDHASNEVGVTMETIIHKMKVLQKERDRLEAEAKQYLREVDFYKQEVERLRNDNHNYFVPYVSNPGDSVRKGLLQAVDKCETALGEVYSYVWPKYPGHVKIGYTSLPAEERLENWQVCNPGARLMAAIKVQFPKRVERLIHLQLAHYRYRVTKCHLNECGRSHEEWFKLPIEYVKQVIHEWRNVIKREPLYDSDGYLTPRWYRRILNFEGEVTAKALLKLLDAEATTRPTTTSVSSHQESALMLPNTTITSNPAQPNEVELPQRKPTANFAGTFKSRTPTAPEMDLVYKPPAPRPIVNTSSLQNEISTGSPVRRRYSSKTQDISSTLPEPVYLDTNLEDYDPATVEVAGTSIPGPRNKILSKMKSFTARYNLRPRHGVMGPLRGR